MLTPWEANSALELLKGIQWWMSLREIGLKDSSIRSVLWLSKWDKLPTRIYSVTRAQWGPQFLLHLVHVTSNWSGRVIYTKRIRWPGMKTVPWVVLVSTSSGTQILDIGLMIAWRLPLNVWRPLASIVGLLAVLMLQKLQWNGLSTWVDHRAYLRWTRLWFIRQNLKILT